MIYNIEEKRKLYDLETIKYSIVGNYNWLNIVGVGSNFFGTAVFVNLKNFNIFDAEFIDAFYKILPVNLSLLGFFSAFILYKSEIEKGI